MMMKIMMMIIPDNKPYIILHDNKQGTCMLVDVPIPGYSNVIRKKLRF
jgi:hypothetical protein